jgi:NAD(P)H-dependent FMN reductase
MAASPKKIALIICSQRNPRVGPQIASFVLDTVTPLATSAAAITLIDLSTWNLPMFNEPTIPQRVHDPTTYVQPHTRAWSAEISQYSGFIFVTPQYNHGYPASVKNAIDYLFNEWAGKAAMIVSYGGHGGTRAAGQLKQVLEAVEMKVVEKSVGLGFPGKAVLVKAATGAELDLGSEGKGGMWEGEREGVRGAFGELLGLMGIEEGKP